MIASIDRQLAEIEREEAQTGRQLLRGEAQGQRKAVTRDGAGPVLQIRKIVEHRSSSGNSVGYFVTLLVGFALWMAYGVVASNLALIIPNAVAAIVITATIAVAWRYRK